MANDYFHLYMNNPTAGGTDGTQVSEDHAFTAPISAVLNASNNESKLIKLAIRCESGYETVGNVELKKLYWNGSTTAETGGNLDKWKFAKDASTPAACTYTIGTNAASGDTIQIGEVVLTAGTDFTVGTDTNATAANIATAINDKSAIWAASASGAAVTVTEKYPGSGNVLVPAVTTGTIAITNGDITSSTAADESAMTDKGVWADTLTFPDTIGDKNKIFWVKAMSSSDEKPQKDNSMVINSNATIQAI